MNLQDADLTATLLAEVEKEVEALLKSESRKLAKAKDESSAPMDEGSADADDAGGAPAGAAPSPAPSASAAPSASPDMDPSAEGAAPSADPSAAPDMGGDMGGDPAQDQAMDPAMLQGEYEKLDDAGLEAHYMAAKAALFARKQAQMGADQGAGPSAPGQAPAAPSASPDMGMMGKEEMSASASAYKDEMSAVDHSGRLHDVAPQGKIKNGADRLDAIAAKKAELNLNNKGNGGVKKSEASELENLQKQVTILTQAMDILTKPMRKAVVEVPFATAGGAESTSDVSKMSKKEITSRLSTKTAHPDMKKSDRELVNRYFDGEVKVDAIAHLLND